MTEKYVKLKYLCEVKSGDFPQNELISEDASYPLIGGGKIISRYPLSNALAQSITVGRVGTIGDVRILEDKSFITDNGFIITANKSIYPRWLYYSLKTINWAHLSSGTAQPLITSTAIKNIKIKYCELSEQKKIADELDRELVDIDELIADAQRLESLEQERMAAERDWAFEQSETSVPLRYMAKFITSGSRGWGDYVGSVGSPFMRITNLRRDSVEPDLSNLLYVDTARLPNDEGKRSQLQVGDILISITADLGSVAVVDESIAGGYVSQHLALVRIDTEKYDPYAIAEAILSSKVKHQINQKSYGGTKVQLSLEDIKELSIPFTNKQLHHKYIHNQDKIINLLIEKRFSLLKTYI